MTDQPASPSALRHFALGAALALVPASLLWWLSVDVIVAAMRPMTAWVAQLLMPITAVAPETEHGWIVSTSLGVTVGKTIPGSEIAIFDLAANYLRRLTIAWPLFIALMLAPPRPPQLLARLLAGSLVLGLLFILSACAVAFCLLAALVNHQPASWIEPPPAILVAYPAFSGASFFLARLGRYAAVQLLPLLMPPVLWALLNPVASSHLASRPGLRRRRDTGRVASARNH